MGRWRDLAEMRPRSSRDLAPLRCIRPSPNPTLTLGSLAPVLIRLAWHSSGTYDKARHNLGLGLISGDRGTHKAKVNNNSTITILEYPL